MIVINTESLSVCISVVRRWEESGSYVRVGLFLAAAMDAGVTGTHGSLWEAGGIVEALRTDAGEWINAIHAGAAITTRVEGTVVYVHVARLP